MYLLANAGSEFDAEAWAALPLERSEALEDTSGPGHPGRQRPRHRPASQSGPYCEFVVYFGDTRSRPGRLLSLIPFGP